MDRGLRRTYRVLAIPKLDSRCRMRVSRPATLLGDLVIKKLIVVLAVVAIGGLVAKKLTSS